MWNFYLNLSLAYILYIFINTTFSVFIKFKLLYCSFYCYTLFLFTQSEIYII